MHFHLQETTPLEISFYQRIAQPLHFSYSFLRKQKHRIIFKMSLQNHGRNNSPGFWSLTATLLRNRKHKRKTVLLMLQFYPSVYTYLPLLEYYRPSFHKFRITKEPQQSQQGEMTKDGFLGKPGNTREEIISKFDFNSKVSFLSKLIL